MKIFKLGSMVAFLALGVSTVAMAQQAPQPSCEDKLDAAKYQLGATMQQELAALKAAQAAAAPKPVAK